MSCCLTEVFDSVVEKLLHDIVIWIHGGSISTETRLLAGWSGFKSQKGEKRDFFLFATVSDHLWGSPSLLPNGIRGSYPVGM